MRATFPMRNTFNFENGVSITSEFEAGNLWKCQQIAAETVNDIEPAEEEEEQRATKENDAEEVKTNSQTIGDDGGAANNESDPETKYSITDTQTLFAPTEDDLYCYDLWVCPDARPYVETIKTRAQFYFSVSGMPQ
jgi:hypothetical protein